MSENIQLHFEKLVASSPVDFEDKLKELLKAFIADPSLYEKPDAAGCFNKILRGGCVSLGDPPRFSGSSDDARRARCTAEILCEFSRSDHPTESNHSPHPVGWKALSKDARGWCVNMLTCELPTGLSKPAVDDILTAKWLVTKIMRDGGLLPVHTTAVDPQRDPLHRPKPEDTLDYPVDE